MSLFDTLSHLFIDRSTGEGVSHFGLYSMATVLFLLGSLTQNKR